MKYTFVLLIICASCTFRKSGEPADRAVDNPASVPSAKVAATPTVGGLRMKEVVNPAIKDQDKELEKITHWFEQMDAVLRESLWVIRKERAPQSKSIFGKMQRALLIERNQKLTNKSLFRCDVYSMTRNVQGLQGYPQTAEAYHKCSSKEGFAKFGSWSHPTADQLQVQFDGSNLSEVLGMATGIFNPKISCKLKSNAAGIIETFSCENLMFDYNPSKNQVLKFKRFEYIKSGKQILHLRAEVLENLEPVRKIEADVPLEGAIEVTETVLKGPPATPPPQAVPAAPTPAPPQMRAGSAPVDPQNDPNNSIREVPRETGQASQSGEASPRAYSPGAMGPGADGPGPLLPDPGAPGVRGGPGRPLAPEHQEGEYHEGGPLPGQGPPIVTPEQGGLPQAYPGGNGTQNPYHQTPNNQTPYNPALPPGVQPMPELGNQPR